MSSLLGIDLGTCSVKAVVFAADGTLKGAGMAEYPILTPRLGYAEQDPEKWWRATIIAVREALEKAGRPQILGIGFSGQMHGLVLLDQRKKPQRAGAGAAMIAGIGAGVFDGYHDVQKLAPVFSVGDRAKPRHGRSLRISLQKLPGNLSQIEELESDLMSK